MRRSTTARRAGKRGPGTNRRILFTLSLGQSGINLNWYSMMKYLRLNRDALDGSVGGVILDGNSEIFTKSTGRSLVFTANRAGCTFPGRPLVEGTRTLKNYNIQANNLHTDNMGAYMAAGKTLRRKHHELQTRKEGASGSARAACQQPQHHRIRSLCGK